MERSEQRQLSLRILGAALIIASAATSVRADVITDWNAATLNVIRQRTTAPPVASRALAILHLAMYDAVNGITRTHASYRVPSTPPASASAVAAASTAAHNVLVALFPADAATFDVLHGATLAGVKDGPQENAGMLWGHQVAAEYLAWRAADGADQTVVPPAGAGAGAWIPTPPMFANYALPHWGSVTPFVMMHGLQFRPIGPPALGTGDWAEQYNEVKALGSANGSTRTEDQTQIALFWADGAGTETPPGHWNSIAQSVARDRGNTMEQNARLFALLNMAMADAAICAWEAKYAFNFWRPVTAIRNGQTDGNPATDPDLSWTPLLVTPPFPDYVSGHSTFSGAAATVLALFYGTDSIAFTTGSDFLPGISRSFPSFSAAAAEAAASRLYGGIHYRAANEDGLQAGIQIGERAMTEFLQPKGTRSRK
jgi:hypothetical protein